MAWIKSFIESIKFNFINFFAYSIFVGYLGICIVIIILDTHATNPHVSEIRNQWGNLCLIVATFYFGANMLSKKKDDQLSDIIQSNVKKDEAIVQVTEANKKLTEQAADGNKHQ